MAITIEMLFVDNAAVNCPLDAKSGLLFFHFHGLHTDFNVQRGRRSFKMKLVTCPALAKPKLHTYTQLYIHIRSILMIAFLGHTYVHTYKHICTYMTADRRREIKSFFELCLKKRAICSFLLLALSASAPPISLLIT